jgi:hypothetical protein
MLPVTAIGRRSADAASVGRSKLSRLLVLALNRVVDFLAMDRDMLWRIDTQTNFIASDIDDRDHHIVPDHDALIAMSRQN